MIPLSRPLLETGASSSQVQSPTSREASQVPIRSRAGRVSSTRRYVPWTPPRSRAQPSRPTSTTAPPRAASTVRIALNPSMASGRPRIAAPVTRRDARDARAASEQAERITAVRCRSTSPYRSPTILSDDASA